MFTTAYAFRSFHINGVDFSIFEWMLVNKPHSHYLHSAIYNVNHFGIHPSWILLPLIPIYQIFASPWVLLIIGATVVWLAGLALFHQGNIHGLTKWDSLILATGFWLSAFAGRLIQQGFRIESFYPLAIILFLHSFETKSLYYIFFAALFCLSIKEDAPLFVAPVLLLESYRKQSYHYLLLGLFSLGFLVIQIKYLQPYFLGSTYISPPYLKFWGHLGSNLNQILWSAFSDPIEICLDILNSSWWTIYLPFLGLPLISLRSTVCILLPMLVLGSASSHSQMHTYQSYYPVPLFAALCWAMIEIYPYFQRPGRYKIWQVACILSPIWHSGWITWRAPNHTLLHEVAIVRSKIQQVAPTLQVCAQPVLFPHLGTDINLQLLDKNCHNAILAPHADPFPLQSNQIDWLVKYNQNIYPSEQLVVIPHIQQPNLWKSLLQKTFAKTINKTKNGHKKA
ncbi:MAG: DUF2079 domain-containing protein [Zetaproteobacteria bacterium]|nr:DUF2079 domain-containing protein [Zetaproteobacteria bacterium]